MKKLNKKRYNLQFFFSVFLIILTIAILVFSILTYFQTKQGTNALERVANSTEKISETLEKKNSNLWIFIILIILVVIIFLIKERRNKIKKKYMSMK